jgi:conserved oligomeric Golgi complex subunit 2
LIFLHVIPVSTDDLDHVASLERAAHTALCLVQYLKVSNAQISALTSKLANSETALPSMKSPLDHDTERAQFILKLAPRIRRLESDVVLSLTYRLEAILKLVKDEERSASTQDELVMTGHCLRGLAILGKGKEAEHVFARVAIMPLIRTKVSMGRLDQGGNRGECAGLYGLLDDMATSISSNYGPVLLLSVTMFDREVDLVTAGVWVPICTALMADAGIKMAIFSPGIATILQANYMALDTFLSELAGRLLNGGKDAMNGGSDDSETDSSLSKLYYHPEVTKETIQSAQKRIYAHPKTAEFSKKWNLPIYYQLRFGDSCQRFNVALSKTQREGWVADAFGASPERLDELKKETGLDLSLFLDLYDIMSEFWSPRVFLRPLSHRFLRGVVQMVGRLTSFVRDGIEGRIQFGEEPKPTTETSVESGNDSNGDVIHSIAKPSYTAPTPFYWNERLEEVAAVAWDLTVLESKMTHDYLDLVGDAMAGPDGNDSEKEELKMLAKEVLSEASGQIAPIVLKAWNEVIVNFLTRRCCQPLAAVKGVAATYRMTNRPPPSQASPFVATILRALKDFDGEFRHRTPPQVGVRWKIEVVNTVAQRYSMAVEELIATVQRTEVAMQKRKTRKTAAGGMSDGEKVKLQLLLDFKAFSMSVQEVGIDPGTVEGIEKLRTLTIDAETLSGPNGV